MLLTTNKRRRANQVILDSSYEETYQGVIYGYVDYHESSYDETTNGTIDMVANHSGNYDETYSGTIDRFDLHSANYNETYSGTIEHTYADTSVLLYLKGDGVDNSTTIIDSSTYNRTITRTGAYISTSQSKYGGSSIYFTSGSNLRIDGLALSGNYTIECWVRTPSASNKGIFQFDDTLGSNFGAFAVRFFQVSSSYYFQVYNSGTLVITSDAVSPSGVWYHLAIVVNGGTTSLFLNGVKDAQVFGNSPSISTQNLYVGMVYSTSFGLTSHIDSFRITNFARYTVNFNPETDTGLAY